MSITRKERRFTYVLLFCYFSWLAVASPLAIAQFDPVAPTPSTAEVPVSQTVTNAQFDSLEGVVSPEVWLQKPEIVRFLSQNFVADGVYGELENGALVDDWQALGSGIGMQGRELANTYSVWRAKEKARLASLRAGEASAIEGLFEAHLDPTAESAVTKEGLVLSNASDWEAFAKDKGVPAGGVALLALYGVWRRRKDQEVFVSAPQTKDYQGHQSLLARLWTKHVGDTLEVGEKEAFEAASSQALTDQAQADFQAVSYTHLTLPTTPYV